MKKVDWDLISFITSSEYRQKVLICIDERQITPTEISNISKVRINHVSVILRELKDKKLVKCLTEQKKKGRFYCLTPYGKEIREFIQSRNEKLKISA